MIKKKRNAKAILTRIVENMVDKKINKTVLNEEESYTSKVKKWFESKGLKVNISKQDFEVIKDGKTILQKHTNSFFRSAHLDSYINQTCKILGIENDWKTNNSTNVSSDFKTMSDEDIKICQKMISQIIKDAESTMSHNVTSVEQFKSFFEDVATKYKRLDSSIFSKY